MNFITPTRMAMTLILTVCAVSQAHAVDYNNLHQQMNILGNIIKSNSANQEKNKTPIITRIDNYYFAGQGAVFHISSSNRHAFSIGGPFNITPVAAPIAPIAPAGFDGEELFGENFEIVIEEALEEAEIEMEIVHDQMREQSEEYHQLREQERDLSYELRDLERNKRDLTFQKSQGDSSKAEIEKELKQIEKQKQAIAKQKEKIQLKNKEYKQKRAKKKQKLQETQQAYFVQLESQLSAVLCDYGNGLKELPKSEQVTFVIKGAGDKAGNRKKDKVLVFNKADIRQCIIEKINAKTLLTKANSYQF